MSPDKKCWQPIDQILSRHAADEDADWDDVFGQDALVTVWPPLATLRRLRSE